MASIDIIFNWIFIFKFIILYHIQIIHSFNFWPEHDLEVTLTWLRYDVALFSFDLTFWHFLTIHSMYILPWVTLSLRKYSLHYITLHYITSHHITSHHITSHHITSHHITSHHITSHHITSHHITSPHHITSHHITSHHLTLHYITLHYITLHYITLHYITLHYITLHYITLHYITLHYITLHYINWIRECYSVTFPLKNVLQNLLRTLNHITGPQFEIEHVLTPVSYCGSAAHGCYWCRYIVIWNAFFRDNIKMRHRV